MNPSECPTHCVSCKKDMTWTGAAGVHEPAWKAPKDPGGLPYFDCPWCGFEHFDGSKADPDALPPSLDGLSLKQLYQDWNKPGHIIPVPKNLKVVGNPPASPTGRAQRMPKSFFDFLKQRHTDDITDQPPAQDSSEPDDSVKDIFFEKLPFVDDLFEQHLRDHREAVARAALRELDKQIMEFDFAEAERRAAERIRWPFIYGEPKDD